jgi:hypothetical protein
MTSPPEFRIYRNLHKNCFSIQKWIPEKRGYRLHSHEQNIIAYDIEFKVSQAGRKRVLQQKQKNVHAFVYCKNYITFVEPVHLGYEVYYDPYSLDSFRIKNSDELLHVAGTLIMTNNKCYLNYGEN